MASNKLIMSVIGVAVGIILLGSLLVPVIQDAQREISDKEIFNNSAGLMSLAESDEILSVTVANKVISVNGVEIPLNSNSNMVLTDSFGLDTYLYQGNRLIRMWIDSSTELLYPTALSLTFEDGVISGSYTVSSETVQVSQPYSWLYYANTEGEYTQINPANNSVYLHNTDEIVLSGLFYTGDNKTAYSYKDGESYTYNELPMQVEYTTEEVQGLFDVVKVTHIDVSIGDETFTPYRIIVPLEVVGHYESETTSILAVIPIIILVAILASVAFNLRLRD